MAELVEDCPRCGASEITFDVLRDHVFEMTGWQRHFELFCVCRRCHRATVFVAAQRMADARQVNEFASPASRQGTINDIVVVSGFLNLSDVSAAPPPEHLPERIEAVFTEGAKCLAIGCYNAAGVMFRLCVDLATVPLLPEGEVNGLNPQIRRDLGRRLPWLFGQKLLPQGLHELSKCVKDDGNDGAHRGTLGKPDAEDLQDFTFELLERLYTEPARLKEAEERRKQRRAKPA